VSFWRRALEDAAAVHRRWWPGRPIGFWPMAWVCLTSKGWRLLTAHRVSFAWVSRRDRGGMPAWQRALGVPLYVIEWLTKAGSKSELLERADIATGVLFAEEGHIIYGARTTGPGCVIGTRCTVGMGLADRALPEIGRDVYIGADCVVYGAISVGDGSTLLPGTVLTRSVPPRTVLHGNPPRVVARDVDNTELRTQPKTNVKAWAAALRSA
jgi:serine acetyltransferase